MRCAFYFERERELVRYEKRPQTAVVTARNYIIRATAAAAAVGYVCIISFYDSAATNVTWSLLPLFLLLFHFRGRLEQFKKESTVVVGFNCGFGIALRHYVYNQNPKQELSSDKGNIQYKTRQYNEHSTTMTRRYFRSRRFPKHWMAGLLPS